jgi:quaternary ammonium compound-resistance protein SugE
MMAWLWLILGGLFEVGFTTSLRFVDGFRNLGWTLAFLVSVSISMALLELAARTIPMGTAYAVWGGIGAIGTVAVGMIWFGEPATTIRVLLIRNDCGSFSNDDEEDDARRGPRGAGGSDRPDGGAARARAGSSAAADRGLRRLRLQPHALGRAGMDDLPDRARQPRP